MDANKRLKIILEQVKSSNLNFHLQQSPFSAIISIKASFVRNKEGVSLKPNTCLLEPKEDCEKLEKKILLLKKETVSIQNEFFQVVNKLEAMTCLNEKLEQANQKLEKNPSDMNVEFVKLKNKKNQLDNMFAIKTRKCIEIKNQ